MSLFISTVLDYFYYIATSFIFAMGILRLLKRCIFRRQPRNLSSLERLPNEIIQHINIFLPLPAAVAFALCSHRLYFVLGNSSWANLVRTEDQIERERKCKDPSIFWCMHDYFEPPAKGEREELILLLDRDLPELIFCHQCALLHRSNTDYETNRTRMCYLSRWITPMIHQMHFISIQMTMKMYRMGLEYKKQLKEFSVHDGDQSQSYPLGFEQYSMCDTREARIVRGNFLVRLQNWFILPLELEEIPSYRVTRIASCPHIDHRTDDEGGLLDMFYCRMKHWREQDLNCPKCSGLRQCSFCETEYQIDARKIGTRGYTIVITRWWNLGPGLSPYDAEFRSHFAWLSIFSHDPPGHPPKVSFEPGSIKGDFEEVYSIDSLLEKYLCGHVLTLNNSRFRYNGKSE